MVVLFVTTKTLSSSRFIMEITQKSVNQLAYEIVGCAIEVHKHLGPGLLDSIYEKCLVQ